MPQTMCRPEAQSPLSRLSGSRIPLHLQNEPRPGRLDPSLQVLRTQTPERMADRNQARFDFPRSCLHFDKAAERIGPQHDGDQSKLVQLKTIVETPR